MITPCSEILAHSRFVPNVTGLNFMRLHQLIIIYSLTYVCILLTLEIFLFISSIFLHLSIIILDFNFSKIKNESRNTYLVLFLHDSVGVGMILQSMYENANISIGYFNCFSFDIFLRQLMRHYRIISMDKIFSDAVLLV